MVKVLRVLNRLNVGGPTYNVAYLSKYMGSEFDTRVLAGIKEPHEGSSEYVLNDLGVQFDYVPTMYRSINLLNDVRAFKHVKQEIQNYKPDIIHTHAAKAGVLGRLAAHYSAERPKAIVHTYHGNVFDGYFSPLKTKVFLGIERYLCSISNAIIAISEQQKDDLVSKYAIAPADKIHVIKLGFDLTKFTENNEAKRADFRKFYRIAEDEIVITITGRITAIKNHALFIKAFKLLKEQNPDKKFKAFIVGDGELLEEIISLTESLGLSSCRPDKQDYAADIVFTSWRKDINVINSGSDIIALTSLNEGTPVSIIEALASGKGVVATNVGGVKDVVQDGKTGLLSDQNPEMFAKKLTELATNQNLRLRLAAGGKDFALKNYSYQRLVNEIEQLYYNLLH